MSRSGLHQNAMMTDDRWPIPRHKRSQQQHNNSLFAGYLCRSFQLNLAKYLAKQLTGLYFWEEFREKSLFCCGAMTRRYQRTTTRTMIRLALLLFGLGFHSNTPQQCTHLAQAETISITTKKSSSSGNSNNKIPAAATGQDDEAKRPPSRGPFELTSQNFDLSVSDGNVWLVEFYTPWWVRRNMISLIRWYRMSVISLYGTIPLCVLCTYVLIFCMIGADTVRTLRPATTASLPSFIRPRKKRFEWAR